MNRDRASVLDECLLDTFEPDVGLVHDLRNTDSDEGRLLLAMCLMRSPNVDHREEAERLLLVGLSRQVGNERRRETAYCLAQTQYSLGKLREARTQCEELLRDQPDNTQALQLHAAIASKHEKQLHSEEMQRVGWITVGVGAVGAVTAFAVMLAMGSKRR